MIRNRLPQRGKTTIRALGMGLAVFLAYGGTAVAELPELLSATELYLDIERKVVSPFALEYAPQYPLWTDGATKQRWLMLPPGGSIDASDPNLWVFPAGTAVWKEFSFGRRVETRVMVLGEDGQWQYGAYVWLADESDAVLAVGGKRRAWTIADGVHHDVPGRYECYACHRGQPQEVLGLSPLQLSSERDPGALHASARRGLDLAELVSRGLVRNLPAPLVESPPLLAAHSARERTVLGYLHGNCGHCHNREGALASLGLDLRAESDAATGETHSRAYETAVDQPARTSARGAASPERIHSGEAGRSQLVERIGTRNPFAQMPPIGTRLIDPEALERIVTWIRDELAPANRP